MHLVEFDDLVRMPAIQFYETSFHKATGVTLRMVRPNDSRQVLVGGTSGNAFCALLSSTPAGCAACRESCERILKSAAAKLAPVQASCFAGLTELAVPVIVGQRHIATLLSGQILRRGPTERDFQMIMEMMRGELDESEKRRAHQTYFETPVLTAERFQAVVQLVTVFAQFVAVYAGHFAVAATPEEPAAVVNAKQFAQSHFNETVTLDEVSQHVGVSRFYFCKLFRKATGLTFTDYVAQLRMEKAKVLLIDPSLRITEVAFAAGFGSIPRFNSVFKQHVGMAPSEYRNSIRSQVTA